MAADVPYKNLLLWCTEVVEKDFKHAAFHQWTAVNECEEDEPSAKIINLIGSRCKEGDCNGIYAARDSMTE